MDLFTTTTYKCSKLVTKHYSTSFTLGIQTLHKRFHYPVYAIYGFVRYADEIVDTFHDQDKGALLKEFKEHTYQAIQRRISLNPILHSFQLVVNEYNIRHDLIDAFLHSMEMDLYKDNYDQQGYEQYIYGSAEVVGLMCLRVFCNGDNDQYTNLEPYAKSLGSAFQKVNFLRDIRSDYSERGRTYFPGVDFENFSASDKKSIEDDIRKDFDHALIGIKNLPDGARGGVYLAYIYYLQLFKKINNLPSSKILNERVRVPDAKKILLLSKTLLMTKLKAL